MACCWGIPIVEFWSLLAPCHTPPHCFKADSNFVGFVIKQHWRLWFLMPSLNPCRSERPFPVEKAFTFFWTWTKMRSIPILWLCTIYSCAIKGCGREILIADERGHVPWAMASNSSHPLKSQALPDCSQACQAMAEEWACMSPQGGCVRLCSSEAGVCNTHVVNK